MTIYYVANGGDDGANGTSELTPWETWDKADDGPYNAGDSILFKEGDAWREEATFPSSGSDGNPITVGSYGSGAKPLFLGSKDGDNAEFWTGSPGGADRNTGLNSDTWAGFPEDDVWVRNMFNATAFSADGGKIRIQLEGHSAEAQVITGVSVGERDGSSPDFDGAPTRITFNIGSSGITLGAGEEKWSDWVNYVWDNTKSHLIHINMNTDGADKWWVRRKYDTGATWWDGYYEGRDQGDKTLVEDVAEDHEDNNNVFMVKQIELETSTDVIWASANSSFANIVNLIFYNTNTDPDDPDRTTKVDNEVDLTEDWEFWYDSTDDRVLLYCGSGNPADYADGIEITWNQGNDTVFLVDTEDYVTIDNIDFRGANGKSVYFSDATGCIAQGCDFYASYSDVRIAWMLRCTSCVFDDLYMYRANASGKIVGDSESIFIELSTSCTVRYCELQEPHHVGINFLWSTDCIAEYNEVYDMDPIDINAGHAGIYFDGASDCIARYNLSHGNLIGMEIGAEMVKGYSGVATDSDNVLFYYNICYLNYTNYSVYEKAGVTTNAKLYNNVSAHYSSGTHSIETYSRDFAIAGDPGIPDGTILRNNVIYGEGSTAYDSLYVEAGSADTDIDYNCWHFGTNGKWDYEETEYTDLATYQAASSQDVHSITGDPLFTDVANQDFTLQPTSPCIDAGVDVGLDRDFAGNPVPQGAAPDMGALERQADDQRRRRVDGTFYSFDTSIGLSNGKI